MFNRADLMDYVLECLKGMIPADVELKQDSDLVNDLGLESIQVMTLLMMLEDKLDISIPMNILLNVRTPEQFLDAILLHLENTHGAI